MKDNPPDILNTIFMRESHVRYALFTSHLSFIVRSRFMVLNIVGVCVSLFGHKQHIFRKFSYRSYIIPGRQVAPNTCGCSVWNFALFNFQAPRILRCFLEFWKISGPWSLQMNKHCTTCKCSILFRPEDPATECGLLGTFCFENIRLALDFLCGFLHLTVTILIIVLP